MWNSEESKGRRKEGTEEGEIRGKKQVEWSRYDEIEVWERWRCRKRLEVAGGWRKE